MAVDANDYPQGTIGSALKPSTAADLLQPIASMERQRLQYRSTAAEVIADFKAPFAGCIERLEAHQLVVGAGANQGSLTLKVKNVSCFTDATDGNTFVGNEPIVAATGFSAKLYPTANLTAMADAVSRVKFAKGDRIIITSVGGHQGTVQVDLDIATDWSAITTVV